MKTTFFILGNEKVTDTRENRKLVWEFVIDHVEDYPSKTMPELFDWNLLMPIIGRINSPVSLKQKGLGEIRDSLNYSAISYHIGITWQLLIQFILEYNNSDVKEPLTT